MNKIICGLALATTACAIIIDDEPDCPGGKCDGAGGGQCTDKRYGDGVCNLDLDCAAPDLDCFHTFTSDDEAATWFAMFEAKLAEETGSPPRALYTQADPRFAKVRDLLDRGWKAFGENRPVGLLKSQRPALVLVEDESVNAFVAPDLDLEHAGLAVMVHTGLLAHSFTDDAMLGLMMHELQHAVGLHVIPENKKRFETFYVAGATGEPIGRNQQEDARARAAADIWLKAGGEIGPQVSANLGGLPMGGDLLRVLRVAIQDGMGSRPQPCQAPIAALQQVLADLGSVTEPLSGAIAPPAEFAPRVAAAFSSLRDQCLPGYPKTFVDIVAQIAGATPQQIEASLTPEDRALIAGKHAIDQVTALTIDRRVKMRAIQDAFEGDTGRPWSALRYFSTEEDADDTSVPVLRGAKLDPAGLGTFLGVLLPEDGASCRAIIDRGAVPSYGVDLVDDHHATCWRVYHIGAYAKETAKRQRPALRPLGTITERPRLLPPSWRDRLAY